MLTGRLSQAGDCLLWLPGVVVLTGFGFGFGGFGFAELTVVDVVVGSPIVVGDVPPHAPSTDAKVMRNNGSSLRDAKSNRLLTFAGLVIVRT